MAKNGAHGSGYLGIIAKRSQVGEPKTGGWVRRDPDKGRVKATNKRSRGSFKDIPREV